MNDKVIKFFSEEPTVYQGSSKAFWDDEHISKGMLAAHLDADNDGASRKLSTIQKSVEWICEQCPNTNRKRLLDLGCGPGIYSELLYDKGFSVTGIDFSKRSIAYAKAHARETNRNIEYRCQNYLDMDFDNEFDIAILIYCDFGVLAPQNRMVLLKKIHRALKNGGILILDVYNEPYLNTFHEMQGVEFEASGFWASAPHVVIWKNRFYRETNNILDSYLVITEDSCECFNTWDQIYSEKTFTEEIIRGKFEMTAVFDDVCGKALTGREETLCGVFTKKV